MMVNDFVSYIFNALKKLVNEHNDSAIYFNSYFIGFFTSKKSNEGMGFSDSTGINLPVFF
jgi:hypothetical protein